MPSMISGPGSDQIPAGDADLEIFAQQFASAWVPATFDVVEPLAVDLQTLADNYTLDLDICSDPTTRTSVTIASKDFRISVLVPQLRLAIRSAVSAFRAGNVSANTVENLGIRVPDLIPTTIGQPADAPLLGLDSVEPGINNLRVTQVVEGVAVSTRRFPYGLVAVEISRSSDGGVTWISHGQQRRVKLSVDVSGVASGPILWRVRYVTARGLTGPWSTTVGSTVLL